MNEIYCFDRYEGYYIAVEQLSSGEYEGIAYKHAHQNPEFVVKNISGEDCLNVLKGMIHETK